MMNELDRFEYGYEMAYGSTDHLDRIEYLEDLLINSNTLLVAV